MQFVFHLACADVLARRRTPRRVRRATPWPLLAGLLATLVALPAAAAHAAAHAGAHHAPKHRAAAAHRLVRHNAPPEPAESDADEAAEQPHVSIPSPDGGLPAPVVAALNRAHIPISSISVVVERLGDRLPIVGWNAGQAMQPASTMKVVTTYGGLSILGPDFRWRTSAFADGPVVNGELRGNLYIEGTGDPKLVPEQLIDLVERIHAAGIMTVSGDLVLDKSYFAANTRDAPPLDDDADAAYNVGPDPLLYAFNALTFSVSPSGGGRADVAVVPQLANLHIFNNVRVVRGACRGVNVASPRIVEHPGGTLDAVFSGTLSSRCGTESANRAVLTHTQFFAGGFLQLWQQTGGSVRGAIREAQVPQSARLIATHLGPPLSDVVHDINKFSNNVMARNLFLTMGAIGGRPPSDIPESSEVINRWLTRIGVPMPELVSDNGSGLSREARISAASLASLLQSAMNSPVAQPFTDSLPTVGVDGTMRNRLRNAGIAGRARIKTGTLGNVRAIAGYVAAENGQTYVVVSFINDPRSEAGRAAHDELLNWVYELAAPPAVTRRGVVRPDLPSSPPATPISPARPNSPLYPASR
ncbi:MAG: D-alanyl-D-alanine carboxypeptidase/D-alanyl-D-alanine endopeptidase [Janthinobacterium lividum]